MTTALATRVVPAALGLLAVASLALWGSSHPRIMVEKRLPGQDGRPLVAAAEAAVDLKGVLVRGEGKPGAAGVDWPWFRGTGRDAISTESVRLIHQIPPSGPKKLWEINVGEGYAGAAVRGGCVYLLDYDEKEHADAVRCLSLDDGREIWRRAYKVDVTRNHGVSRTVPAVTEKLVITIGPKCHVVCLDRSNGDFKWGIDLAREYGTTVPQWYAGQCPLVDGDRLILGIGGRDTLIAAIDLNTGKPIWTTPNPRHWEMTHSSIAPIMLGGRKLYVYPASGGVAMASAETGQLLGEYPDWKVTMANVPTPVAVGEGRVFLSGGYGAGSMMLGLSWAGEKVITSPIFRLKPEIFGAEQHTPILYKDHLYGVVPPAGQMVCLDLNGNRVWASGSKDRFGKGPFIIADGMIVGVSESGVLMLAEATHEGWRPLGQAKLWADGDEAWGPLALCGGKLIARDLTRMICIDLREGKP
jgi:outer membrane protein assembly factor BamB